MKLDRVCTALREARDFVVLADYLIQEAIHKGLRVDRDEIKGKNPASLKRASMDLTRALADMRNG